MLKADVLREKKRLKAVRRKKREIKKHNYIIKTLAVKDTINKLINFNKERIKSRVRR